MGNEIIAELADAVLQNLVVVTVRSGDNPADEPSRGKWPNRVGMKQRPTIASFWEKVSRCCKQVKDFVEGRATVYSIDDVKTAPSGKGCPLRHQGPDDCDWAVGGNLFRGVTDFRGLGCGRSEVMPP